MIRAVCDDRLSLKRLTAVSSISHIAQEWTLNQTNKLKRLHSKKCYSTDTNDLIWKSEVRRYFHLQAASNVKPRTALVI